MQKLEVQEKEVFSVASEQEDKAMKTTLRFFSEAILPQFGIKMKVKGFGPTESVHLELKKTFEDLNLIMSDDSWSHFEFQSSNGGRADLRRFRFYESTISYQYGVSVTTYVIFSGTIKKPMYKLAEGINTYSVVPVTMADKDGEKVLKRLNTKRKRGKKLCKKDFAELSLLPLMGGSLSQKERIAQAFEITAQEESCEALRMAEAVIYTFAEKFLNKNEFNEIKERLKMTWLGNMLVEEGIKQGEKDTLKTMAKNLLDVLSPEVIARKTGLPLEEIMELKEQSAQEDPEEGNLGT